MIIHREADSDFKAFKIAQIFDHEGLRIVAIQEDSIGRWHVWAQGLETNTAVIDIKIDALKEREYSADFKRAGI